jgi:hypothetical protein
MDATSAIKLLKSMPCEKCGQFLPPGSFVFNVRATITPRFEGTPNYEAWRLDATQLESPRVTCGRCARREGPSQPSMAEIAGE